MLSTPRALALLSFPFSVFMQVSPGLFHHLSYSIWISPFSCSSRIASDILSRHGEPAKFVENHIEVAYRFKVSLETGSTSTILRIAETALYLNSTNVQTSGVRTKLFEFPPNINIQMCRKIVTGRRTFSQIYYEITSHGGNYVTTDWFK